MVALMPFACDTFGGSSPEGTGLLRSITLEMSRKHNNSKAFRLSHVPPGYLFLFSKQKQTIAI